MGKDFKLETKHELAMVEGLDLEEVILDITED